MACAYYSLHLSGGLDTGDNNLDHAIQTLLRSQRKFFISVLCYFLSCFQALYVVLLSIKDVSWFTYSPAD